MSHLPEFRQNSNHHYKIVFFSHVTQDCCLVLAQKGTSKLDLKDGHKIILVALAL